MCQLSYLAYESFVAKRSRMNWDGDNLLCRKWFYIANCLQYFWLYGIHTTLLTIHKFWLHSVSMKFSFSKDYQFWSLLLKRSSCNPVVPQPSSNNFEYLLTSKKIMTRRADLCSHSNCAVMFCEPTEEFACFAKLYTNVRALNYQWNGSG